MRFLKPVIVTTLILTVFFSCKKDSSTFDTTPNFYILNGDTSNFAKTLVLFPSADTITFNLIISSTYLLPQATTINIDVDDSYRTAYNSSHGTNYKAMPSNAYSFQTTINATTNTVYDTVPVRLNKQYLASDNFLLPIRITTVSNYKIDTSSAVIYLHTEDNALSGIYSSKVSKMSYTGDASDNNLISTDTFTLVKGLVPINSLSSQLDYADLGSNGWEYVLSFGADGSGFTVAANDVIKSSIQTNSFTVLSSSYDAATKKIYIKTSYKNTSGNERIVEESLSLY